MRKFCRMRYLADLIVLFFDRLYPVIQQFFRKDIPLEQIIMILLEPFQSSTKRNRKMFELGFLFF